MSKSDALENDILELLFNGTAIADLAENDSISPATDLYVSLHTASPGEAGSQSTNEAAYPDYSRVAVPRSGSEWTVTASSASPTNNIDFPTATGGSETITHVGIGTASNGAGYLMYYGALSPTISVSNGVTPRVTTASTITED